MWREDESVTNEVDEVFDIGFKLLNRDAFVIHVIHHDDLRGSSGRHEAPTNVPCLYLLNSDNKRIPNIHGKNNTQVATRLTLIIDRWVLFPLLQNQ